MNHKSLTVFALVVLAIGCQGSSSTQFSDAPTDVIEKIRLSDLAGSLIAYPPEDQAILLDSFNDKARTNLDQHTPDRAPGSSRWVNVSGQWTVESNSARQTLDEDNDARAVISVPAQNTWVETDLTWESGSIGLVFRYRDEANWFIAWVNGQEIIVGSKVDNQFIEVGRTPFQIGSASTALTLSVLDYRDEFHVAVNGLSHLTIQDSRLASETGIGMFTRQPGKSAFQQFRMWDAPAREIPALADSLIPTATPTGSSLTSTTTSTQSTSTPGISESNVAVPSLSPPVVITGAGSGESIFDNALNFAGRQLRSASIERGILPPGGDLELLQISEGGGRIVNINIIFGMTSLEPRVAAEKARIVISVDGEEIPSVDLELADFFFTRGFAPGTGNPTGWTSDLVGVSSYRIDESRADPAAGVGSDVRVGYYRFIDIPFQDSISISLVNADPVNEALVFPVISYITGAPFADDEAHYRLKIARNTGTIVSPGDSVDLLMQPQGSGFVESVYMSVREDIGVSFSWPEMNVVGRFGDEDDIGFSSPGTEDFFMSSWAWSLGPTSSRYHGHPVHRQDGWNAQYRYFPTGLWFTDGFSMTWEPGPTDPPEMTAGGRVGPVELFSVVTYYLVVR